MKLTCVTAVFNAIKSGNHDNLIRCVRSVAALKTEHEHLIYDGGSTDGTVELLRELEAKVNGSGVGVGGRCRCTEEGERFPSDAERTPRLRVVSEPDTGIYNALNKGVRDARGELFYVLGCDDYICHSEVMDDILKTFDSKVTVIATRVERDIHPEWFMQSLQDLKSIFISTPVCHQGEIVRTASIRELNGFDERYKIAADADLLFKLHLRGARFLYDMRKFAHYEAGGVSERAAQDARDEFFNCMQINLGLNDAERGALQKEWVLPIRLILRFLFHHDLALRMGTRYMIKIRLMKIPLIRHLHKFATTIFN